MQTRKLGYTDLHLTTVGFGAWAIGGGDWKFSWGPQDDQISIDAIHTAIDQGVNWIDTAAVYGLGHSEEIVGKALKGLSKKPIVATKCGRVWDDKGDISGNIKKKSIRKEAEDSLRRLQTDVIDLYQIHWPQPEEDLEEAWSAMAELVNEGKVRYIGVSNFNVEQLNRIQSIHPVASLQPPYSMLRREIEKDLLNYCSKNHIGVIVYSPMQKGLLTGKMSIDRIKKFPIDDHRRNDKMFQEPMINQILELVDQLIPLAEDEGKSMAQLSIAWVLRRPEVTSAIVGTRSPEQIKETVPGGKWILSPEQINRIDRFLNKYQVKI